MFYSSNDWMSRDVFSQVCLSSWAHGFKYLFIAVSCVRSFCQQFSSLRTAEDSVIGSSCSGLCCESWSPELWFVSSASFRVWGIDLFFHRSFSLAWYALAGVTILHSTHLNKQPSPFTLFWLWSHLRVCAQAPESRLKLRFGPSRSPRGRPWRVGSPRSLLSSTRRPVGLLGCWGGSGRLATCCGYRSAPRCAAERMASPGTKQRCWRPQLRGAAGLEKRCQRATPGAEY